MTGDAGLTGGQWAYIALVLAVIVARFVELGVARRHLLWARQRGAVEYGAGHYPVMVAVHTLFLASCLIETVVADRPFLPWLGWPMLALLAGAHALRWWCIRTLGVQWNTRVLIVPGVPLRTGGPYRWLRHPNYVAVVVELAALPLVHTNWVTAVVFGLANFVVLGVRIRVEERALATAPARVVPRLS
jgi:methyltransferase